MLRQLTACFLAAGCASVVSAGPAETTVIAAMRLSEQSNYSWITTVTDDARTYVISGRTTQAGYTRLRMPAINAVRRRLGRGSTDTEIDFIFRGTTACVVETENGWMRPDELPPESEAAAETRRTANPALPTGLPSLPLPGAANGRQRRYSNLQLGLSRPHDELGIIVSSHDKMTVEGDLASGTLTDVGARLLLVREGQSEVAPLRAAGTFKLWLRDGIATKYQLRLEGLLQVDTPGGRREIVVNQTTDTVIRDIGTTHFDLPDQAKIKLGP